MCHVNIRLPASKLSVDHGVFRLEFMSVLNIEKPVEYLSNPYFRCECVCSCVRVS